MDDRGNSFANGESASGNGLPGVRCQDWQFMEGVWRPRVTIYDFA